MSRLGLERRLALRERLSLGVLGSTRVPFTTNLKQSNTSNFRTAWRNGSGNVGIAFYGSSFMRGTDETAIPYNAQFGAAIPMQVATRLKALGIAAGANNLFGSGTTTAADLVLRDGRFAFTGAVGFGSTAVQGGQDISFNAATGTMTFTFPDAVNEAVIVWRDASVGRTFSWAVDGGAATNISSSGASTYAKNTISLGTLATHTITLAWVAGGATIFGIYAYNNTRREMSCWQWGCNGFDAGAMNSENGAPNGGRATGQAFLAPKLGITESGAVNSWRLSQSVATFKASLTTQIQAMKAASIDPIILTDPFDGGSTGLTANQNAYVTAEYEVSSEQDVPLLDIRLKWLSFANQTALNLTGDNIHGTIAAGYPDVASMIVPVIQRIM